MSGIFVLDSGRKLHELREQPYETEALLQELLAEFPNLLAGELVDAEEPRRWLLISREVGLADGDESSERWAVDHLFVDQDGIPTIVEVKRSSDTRLRREVVGQVLEYAANAVSYWPVEKLQARFEDRCQRAGTDAMQALQTLLGDAADPAAFWGTVKTNLKAGKIRILLVGDSIPAEVRRIVEFLNAQMTSAEILAVEIKQFGNEDLKTLVPRVYGQTEAATGVKTPGGVGASRSWDEETFLNDLDGRFAGAERQVARRVLEGGKSRSLAVKWGKGATYGSFTLVRRSAIRPGVRLSLATVYGNGYFAVPFAEWGRADVDRQGFLDRLNTAAGAALPATAIDRWPSIRLAELARGDTLDRVIALFAELLDQLERREHANLQSVDGLVRTQD
jgi:hypothetical protein